MKISKSEDPDENKESLKQNEEVNNKVVIIGDNKNKEQSNLYNKFQYLVLITYFLRINLKIS